MAELLTDLSEPTHQKDADRASILALDQAERRRCVTRSQAKQAELKYVDLAGGDASFIGTVNEHEMLIECLRQAFQCVSVARAIRHAPRL